MMVAKNEPSLSEEFIEQVKEALGSLYDFPTLQQHPLAQSMPDEGTSREPAAHRLRRELIEAIESLNPGNSVSIRSNPARLYNLMHLHYIGDMTLQETSMELGISSRQAYRDLRRGQESIAGILWFNRRDTQTDNSTPELPVVETETARLSSIQSEITRLERDFKITDINGILSLAVKAVHRLSNQQNISLQVDTGQEPIQLSTNQAIAQQIFINILSQTIQHAQAGDIHIQLVTMHMGAQLQIRFMSTLNEINSDLVAPVIHQLLEQLQWHIKQSQLENGEILLTIHMNGHGTKVLIIDDNEGLVDLLMHYISSDVYQVVTANNGADGLRMAMDIIPDAIVMDLMMPEMDGWELLQRLRSQSDTKSIPVIICSVIHDPELAYSLGADVFIAKPVNKDQVLNALKELNI